MTDDRRAQARERVVTAIERSAAEYGLPRSAGRLYGLLYFAEEPLSLDDLSEQSGYAKSTVSDTIGLLEDVYLVRQVRPPGGGGRRSYYEPERDLWYAFYRIAQESGRREVQLMTRALDEAEGTLTQVDDPGTDLDRVRSLQEMYDHAELLLDLLDSVPPETLREIIVRAAWLADAGETPADLDVEGLANEFDMTDSAAPPDAATVESSNSSDPANPESNRSGPANHDSNPSGPANRDSNPSGSDRSDTPSTEDEPADR